MIIDKAAIDKYHLGKKMYYTGTPIMTDPEWDFFESEILKVHPELKYVGTKDKDDKTYHPSPLGSLDKSQVRSGIADVREDVVDFITKPPSNDLEASPKLDGNSLNVVYVHGKLTSGITRGDGIVGTDRVDKLRGLVPDTIPIIDNVEIRGELIVPEELWVKKYSLLLKKDGTPRYANSRNMVAGFVTQDDYTLKELGVEFVAFEIRHHTKDKIIFLDNTIDTLKKWGFTVPEYFKFKTWQDFVQIYNHFVNVRPTYKYQLDGIVLKWHESNRSVKKGNPDWGLSIKFIPVQVITSIIDIKLQTGTTGEITPVALLKPVDLMGSTVKKASMYNYDWVNVNKCYPGAVVEIVKSGDIIPQIVNVVTPSNIPYTWPTECPACNSSLFVTGGHLMCSNKQCRAIVRGEFKRWISAIKVKGLGDSMVDDIFDAGIKTPEDFIVNFNHTYLTSNNILSGRNMEKALAEWKKVKSLTPDKIVHSIGIAGMGESTALEVSKLWEGGVPDFGGKEGAIVAQFVIGSEKHKRYESLKKLLISYGIAIDIKKPKTGGILAEFTGSPKDDGYKTKEEFAIAFNIIETKLKDAQFLITNSYTSSSGKMDEAKKLGKTIITYADFIQKSVNN